MADRELVFDDRGNELCQIQWVCRGRGRHPERPLGKFFLAAPDGWVLERGGDPARSVTIWQDSPGATWNITCPSCLRTPKRLSARNMRRFLDAALDTRETVIDLARLNL
jgi:hypothetical protein